MTMYFWKIAIWLSGPLRRSRALFLDRDGVINIDIGYAYKQEDIVFIPGIFSLCRIAKQQGMKIIVITNQAGIAHGLYSEHEFEKLMQWMKVIFCKEGCDIDGVYFCPYHEDGLKDAYRKASNMRKPMPGMLYKAALAHRICLRQSIIIGDKISDMKAGINAKIGRLFWLSCSNDKEWDWCRYESVDEIATKLSQ